MWLTFRLQVFLISMCFAEKITYISTEHPGVTYYNPKHVAYINLTSQRYSRNDPFYYVGFHVYFKWPVYNNISADFYFYEWLSNQYKRGFVEMHWKICDLIHKDKFFGTALNQGRFAKPCPWPAGAYNAYNMTIPVKHIPANFPFQKGRIYCNLSSTDTNELVASGYINMEIKQFNTNKKKNNV